MARARVVGRAAMTASTLAAMFAVLVIVAGLISGADIRSAGDCESEDHPEACTTELEMGLVGSAMLAVAGWGVAAGWGLCRGRARARRSVIVTHSLWAIAVASYFASVAAAPEGLEVSGVVVGLALTGTFLAIAAAAARLPPTGKDVSPVDPH